MGKWVFKAYFRAYFVGKAVFEDILSVLVAH